MRFDGFVPSVAFRWEYLGLYGWGGSVTLGAADPGSIQRKGWHRQDDDGGECSRHPRERGLCVLVVDLDLQAAALAWLGVHEPDDVLADALIDDASLRTAVVASTVTGVEVIGATRRLAAA